MSSYHDSVAINVLIIPIGIFQLISAVLLHSNVSVNENLPLKWEHP